MTRLVIFLSLLVGLTIAMASNGLKYLPVGNDKFNLVQAEKTNQEKKLAQIKEEEKAQAHASGENTEGAELAAEGNSGDSPIPLDTEELKRGFTIFTKTGKCVTCHGRNGEGKSSQQAPKLAAQHDWYIYDQLVAMKTNVRSNPKMTIYLKNLKEQDFKDVAQYLSHLPPQ